MRAILPRVELETWINLRSDPSSPVTEGFLCLCLQGYDTGLWLIGLDDSEDYNVPIRAISMISPHFRHIIFIQWSDSSTVISLHPSKRCSRGCSGCQIIAHLTRSHGADANIFTNANIFASCLLSSTASLVRHPLVWRSFHYFTRLVSIYGK